MTAAAAASAATSGASASILQAAGYVAAEREATVSSEIPGELHEGDHVQPGQVPPRLEDSAQRAASDQAAAQLAAARTQ